jgi:hypothetical protein
MGPDLMYCIKCIKASGNMKYNVYSPSPEDWDILKCEEQKLAAALDATEIEY